MQHIRNLDNLAFRQTYRGDFQNGIGYSINDNVKFGNALYRSRTDNNSATPSLISALWEAVTQPAGGLPLMTLLMRDGDMFFNFGGQLVTLPAEGEGGALGVFSGRLSYGFPANTIEALEQFTVSDGDLPNHLIGFTGSGELGRGRYERVEVLTSRQRHGEIVRVHSNEVTSVGVTQGTTSAGGTGYLIGKRIGTSSSDFLPELFHNNILDVTLAHTGDEATIEQEKAIVVTFERNIQGIGENNDNFLLDSAAGANTSVFVDIASPGDVDRAFIARNNSSYFYISTAMLLFAWGHNFNGELGLGFSSGTPSDITQVPLLSDVRDIQFSGTYGSTKRSLAIVTTGEGIGTTYWLFGSQSSASAPVTAQFFGGNSSSHTPIDITPTFESNEYGIKVVMSKTGDGTESIAILTNLGRVFVSGSSSVLGTNYSPFTEITSTYVNFRTAVAETIPDQIIDLDFMTVSVGPDEEGCLVMISRHRIYFIGRSVGNIYRLAFPGDQTDTSNFVTTVMRRIYYSQTPMRSIKGCDFESDNFIDAYSVITNTNGRPRILGFSPHRRINDFACGVDETNSGFNNFLYNEVRT